MKKLTSLWLIVLILFCNINAISIKKNYLGLSSKKGILSDILKNNIEVEKEQNDEYTNLIFKIYKDKALKDKTKQDVNQVAKSIADYLRGQKQVPKQIQKAVQEAVDHIQDITQKQNVTSKQVQQAFQQVLEQLPK